MELMSEEQWNEWDDWQADKYLDDYKSYIHQ